MKMRYSRKKTEEDSQSENENDEEIESEVESVSSEHNSEENSGDDSEEGIYDNEEQEEKEESLPQFDNFTPSESNKKGFTDTLLNIRSNIDDVNKKMKSVLTSFSQSDKAEIKYGISYLDAKNYFMLVYLTDLLMYSLSKCTGKSVANSPILKQMIYLKTIMERTKVIDIKLKTQIDRLIKLGEKSLEENNKEKEAEIDENDFRPMILDNEEEGEEDEQEEEKKKVKYKVQRDFQEFFETTDENKKRKKQIEKVKDKVRNSEMYKEIREQFNDAPKEVNPYDNEYSKFMNQVEEYEENNFTRVKVPKRELKKLRKMDRKNDDFSDLGREFKNMENLLHQEHRDEVSSQTKFLNKKKFVGDMISKRNNANKQNGRKTFTKRKF